MLNQSVDEFMRTMRSKLGIPYPLCIMDALISDRSIPAESKLIWRHLCYRSNKETGKCCCDLKIIAKLFDMTPTVAERLIFLLVKADWLKIEDLGQRGMIACVQVGLPK